MYVINHCFFPHHGEVNYLPLIALSHQSSHLAGSLSTYSFVATGEGNHETSTSTIVEAFVGHMTI